MGDEVPVSDFHFGVGGSTNSFGTGANSTNVWLSLFVTNAINCRNKTNGADTTITNVNWIARNYSTFQNY